MTQTGPTQKQPTPIRPSAIAGIQQVASLIAADANTPAARITQITTQIIQDAMMRAAVVASITKERAIRAAEAKEIERIGIAAWEIALLEIITNESAYPLDVRTLATQVYVSKESRRIVTGHIATMARGYIGTAVDMAIVNREVAKAQGAQPQSE